MNQIILIAHNLRSSHNVGSLLRTADGLGVREVILSGYTPYPTTKDDERLPHIARKLSAQISKTALGAETTQSWRHVPDIHLVIAELRAMGYVISGLEQTKTSNPLPGYRAPKKLALIVGREVKGLEPEIMALCDELLEIPMFGGKESYNVVQAAAMALYQSRFYGIV